MGTISRALSQYPGSRGVGEAWGIVKWLYTYLLGYAANAESLAFPKFAYKDRRLVRVIL